MRLLELAKPVQEMVMDAKLDMGHARALLSLVKSKQIELAHQIVHGALSVRDAEKLVKAESAPPRATKTAISQSGDARRLENELAEKLGTRVTLKTDLSGDRKSVV